MASASAAPAECQGDVHAWLSQRLAALQQERQTRWQKNPQSSNGEMNGEGSALTPSRSTRQRQRSSLRYRTGVVAEMKPSYQGCVNEREQDVGLLR